MSNMVLAQTQPQPTRPSALGVMASRLSVEPSKLMATLKATVFAKATDEEMMALVVVANEYALNPFLKELYAFPAKGGGIVPIVSVDGWNKMMVRHPDFDGITFDFTSDASGAVESCTATVHLKHRSHPVSVTEWYAECKRNTEPWNTMPRRMLRNRTLCQAARMAFGFSGIHNEEEAEAITVESTVVQKEAPESPSQKTGAAFRSEAAASGATATTQLPNGMAAKDELARFVLSSGFTFEHLQRFGVSTGNLTNAADLTGFDDVDNDEAKRLLRGKTTLIKLLTGIKEGQV